MNTTFKQSFDVEINMDVPLLGYNPKDMVLQRNKDKVLELIEKLIENSDEDVIIDNNIKVIKSEYKFIKKQ